MPRKMSGRKRLAYGTGKINAVSAELCEQAKRNKKISRATIATAPTVALDSSGTCDGERRMAVEKCARRLWLECVTSNPMGIADDLGHRFWRLLPDSRPTVN